MKRTTNVKSKDLTLLAVPCWLFLCCQIKKLPWSDPGALAFSSAYVPSACSASRCMALIPSSCLTLSEKAKTANCNGFQTSSALRRFNLWIDWNLWNVWNWFWLYASIQRASAAHDRRAVWRFG